MDIVFKHLNVDWNAEPNAPDETINIEGNDLILEFTVNPWAYEGFNEEERCKVIFKNCTKYRIGNINDEGWHRKQCRFSNLAPTWGEFFQVIGDVDKLNDPKNWNVMGDNGKNHYLFYLRDNEIEVKAENYEFARINT